MLDLLAHLATKLSALLDRPDSTPGDKDRHEIIALLALAVDDGDAVNVIHHASACQPEDVTRLLAQAFDYLGQLALDRTRRRTLNQHAHNWQGHSAQLAQGAPAPTDPETRQHPQREPGRGLDL